MLHRIKAAVAGGQVPPPEPNAMSYMMSKEQFLNDGVGHWFPHLMFHLPKIDGASWGANLDNSPVVLGPRLFPEQETFFCTGWQVVGWNAGPGNVGTFNISTPAPRC